MTPERDIDHVGQGLALLISQFRGKPRLEGWARAYLRQCQLLEDAIYDVLIKRLIDNAEGVNLDTIGRIVGELRFGRSDATYKIFIGARVRINRSRGNTTDVLEVLGMITKTSLIFNEYNPACLFIEMLTVPDQEPILIYIMAHDTKAGGVKLTLIAPTTNTRAARPKSAVGGPANNALYALGDARDLHAVRTNVNPGPYALTNGMTLIVSFDGDTPITYTFRTADFVAIGAATAAEVVAVLNRERRRRFRASVYAGAGTNRFVRFTTYRVGAGTSVQVIGGTANAALGFVTTAITGTGDATFGLLSDAVTVRDPMAEPITAPPGAPVITYVDPGSGP